MQKKAIPIAIAAAVVVAIFILVRITGLLQFYKVSSTSGLPTHPIGKQVISSNLRSVERNRFVFFRQYDSLLQKEAIWFHRCVGMPGDTLLMKNGVLYVNGHKGDIENKVWRMYNLRTNRAAYWLNKYKDRLDEYTLQWINPEDTTVDVPLTLAEVARLQTSFQPAERLLMLDVTSLTPGYFLQLEQHNWTIDNFGPMIVPDDSYFVLGDNRHNAMESRFIGPIAQSAIRGVLL